MKNIFTGRIFNEMIKKTKSNMKIKISLLLGLFFVQSFSQEIPVEKYDTNVIYQSYMDQIAPKQKYNSFYLGYSNKSFLNNYYGELVEDGKIKFSYGIGLGYRKNVEKMILFDVNAHFHQINNEDLKLYNYGGEFAAGIILMPFTLKLTSYVQPYAMIGYDYSIIGILGSTSSELVEGYKDKTTDVSAVIWKTGLMVNVSPVFFINGEYKQSISSKSDRNFNNWFFGFGLRY